MKILILLLIMSFFNFKLGKKGVSMIVAMSLLLSIAVVGGIMIQNWGNKFTSDYESDMIASSPVKLEIIGLKTNGASQSFLGIRNLGKNIHSLNKIFINGNQCTLISINQISNGGIFNLNCSVILGKNYEIVILTDKAEFSKTVTVWE